MESPPVSRLLREIRKHPLTMITGIVVISFILGFAFSKILEATVPALFGG